MRLPSFILVIDEDILVMKDDDHPNYMWGAQVTTPDGRYLVLYISRDTARVSLFPAFYSHAQFNVARQQNLLWITDLEVSNNPIGPNMNWIKLIDEWDAEYSV